MDKEKMICYSSGGDEAHWRDEGRDIFTCSFCGSLHPDTVKRLLEDDGRVDITDKRYKVYVKHGDLSRTGKFYTWHAPTWEDDPYWWELMRKREDEAHDRFREMISV